MPTLRILSNFLARNRHDACENDGQICFGTLTQTEKRAIRKSGTASINGAAVVLPKVASCAVRHAGLLVEIALRDKAFSLHRED